MKTKIYLARLNNDVTWQGMCKHYSYEGKNILACRFISGPEWIQDGGILEVLAEQKEASEKLSGMYKCNISTRQLGTEKHEIEAEWNEECEMYVVGSNSLMLNIHFDGRQFSLDVDTSEEFSDFLSYS